MIFYTLVTLISLQQTIAYQIDEKGPNFTYNSTLYSFICDDEKLHHMEEKLNRIITENENLRLRMDLMTVNNNQQFAEVKTAITTSRTTTQTETVVSNCSNSTEQLIDIRGNFSEDKQYIQPVNQSKQGLPRNCAEAFQLNGHHTGLHRIYLSDSKLEPFFVYCLADPEQPDAPWTIIQRRIDGSIDFYRKWVDYQQGFGNLEGEFFIGLDKLHALTQSSLHELWIKMDDFENATRSAYYSSFGIGDKSEAYALKILGCFSGDAGDSLKAHAGQKFTTQDVDNDSHDAGNCAKDYTGAWWYKKCHASNLNGQYLKGKTTVYAKGVVWYDWHQHYYSLKYVHMAIRPVSTRKLC